jgi:hypothetical protein
VVTDPWYYLRFKPWLRAHAEAVAARSGHGYSFGDEITLTPGVGGTRPDGSPDRGGSFIFRLASGTEILRLRHDGAVLLDGSTTPTTARKDALAAFHLWLSQCSVERERQTR